MGQKRGKVEGSFVRETRLQTFDLAAEVGIDDVFYGDLVQNLKSWQARGPKLRDDEPEPATVQDAASDEPEAIVVGPQSDPPPFSADQRDAGEAPDPQAADRWSPWNGSQ